jgi:GxxExxY protein
MLLHEELTDKIINAAIEVHNTLGSGFLEKVYENSLILELMSRDLLVEQQKNVKVFYKGLEVGNYIADIIVENKVVIELKSVKSLDPIFSCQLLNYLKALNMQVGLLLNFGNSKLEIKRLINTDQVKDRRL